MFIFSGGIALLIIVLPFVMAFVSYYRFLMNSNTVALKTVMLKADSILDAPMTVPTRKKEPGILLIPELIFMAISPIYSLWLVVKFHQEIQPFHLHYAFSLGIYILIAYASYWTSRLGKDQLPDIIKILCHYGMIIGLFIYTLLAIHFLSYLTILGGLFLPYLAVPLIVWPKARAA